MTNAKRDSPLQRLRSWLRANASPGAVLELPRADVEALTEELARLEQSNDRLRKQNKKVRRKIERKLGESEPDDQISTDGEPEPSAPSAPADAP